MVAFATEKVLLTHNCFLLIHCDTEDISGAQMWRMHGVRGFNPPPPKFARCWRELKVCPTALILAKTFPANSKNSMYQLNFHEKFHFQKISQAIAFLIPGYVWAFNLL